MTELYGNSLKIAVIYKSEWQRQGKKRYVTFSGGGFNPGDIWLISP